MQGNGSYVNSAIAKVTILFLCTALLISLTWYGRTIVIPILFAILVGIALRPIEHFFNKKLHIPRVIAILVTVIIFMCVISGIIIFTTYEFTRFMHDLPQLRRNLEGHFSTIRNWIAESFHFEYSEQQAYINNAAMRITSNPSAIAQRTLTSLYSIFNATLVFPVLLFLVLYYRPLFLNFLLKVFGERNRGNSTTIITETKLVMQRYIGGLFLEMICVASLQTLAMWIVGIKYFVFIGLVTGVLNLIPYIGTLIAGMMGILIALAAGADLQQIVFMILGFTSVQFIDNNILLPNLVGHRVRINAFFSIAGVITGGLICGVAGMFLAIPLMAVIKVVFDNIDHLKPWGELMGDTLPRTVKWKNIHWPKIN